MRSKSVDKASVECRNADHVQQKTAALRWMAKKAVKFWERGLTESKIHVQSCKWMSSLYFICARLNLSMHERRRKCIMKSGGVNETFNDLSNGRKWILGKTSKKKRTRERRVSCDTHTHTHVYHFKWENAEFYCWQVGPFKLQPNSIWACNF